MNSTSETQGKLRTLLDDITRDPATGVAKIQALPPTEVIHLFSAFTAQKNTQEDLRSSAYLALSSLVSAIRASSSSNPDKTTRALVAAFSPSVTEALSGTAFTPILSTLNFLAALFQVDPLSAASLLKQDGVFDSILDIVDIFPLTNTSSGDSSQSTQVSIALASLYSQAAGQKETRSLLRQADESRCVGWLRKNVGSSDTQLRAGAALALTKLAKGGLQDTESAGVGEPSFEATEDEERLVRLMRAVTLNAPTDSAALLDAIESLAYLSSDLSVKVDLAKDAAFLKRIVEIGIASSPLQPKKKSRETRVDPRLNVGLHYGISVILFNLTIYKPRLSGEEEQVARLKKMTKLPGSQNGKPKLETAKDDPRESDNAVRERIKLVLQAGIIPLLAGLARSDSLTARRFVGRVYLAIVEEQLNRGLVLQGGGSKALLHIITTNKSEKDKDGNAATPDFFSIQALAKLAITASPLQVFGPDPGSTYNAIHPLVMVLLPPTSSFKADSNQPTSLQRFEALMALTNIASMGAQYAARIISSHYNKFWAGLEILLLDDHHLIQRAAMELVCNLVVCDEGFARYAPSNSPATSPSRPGKKSQTNHPPSTTITQAESRLQILVALSDVEDLPTRKASSGALAMLTSDEGVCGVIVEMEKKKGNVVAILGRLLTDNEYESEEEENPAIEDESRTPKPGDPKGKSKGINAESSDIALAHRGIVVLRNLIRLGGGAGSSTSQDARSAFLESIAKQRIVERVEAVVKLAMEDDQDRRAMLETAVDLVLGLKEAVGHD